VLLSRRLICAQPAPDKLATKSRRQVIKLPWEVTTYYSNFLAGHAAKRRRLASATGAPVQDDDDADDEDEDDMEANEDLLTRLRVRRLLPAGATVQARTSTDTAALLVQDADLLTRDMTREEYAHYSECRQASFTFKKGKRFREFINFSAYLDAKPNDEIIVRPVSIPGPPRRRSRDPKLTSETSCRTFLASFATRWCTR
jgi:transcription initiation protein SPT3